MTPLSLAYRTLGSLLYFSPARTELAPLLPFIQSGELGEEWPMGAGEALQEACRLMQQGSQDVTAITTEFIRLFEAEAAPVATTAEAYLQPSAEVAKHQPQLQALLRQFGLEPAASEQVDGQHIALLLFLLAHLVEHGVHGTDNEALHRWVLEQHLLPWSHAFLARLEQSTEQDFYRGVAQLVQISLNAAQADFELTPVQRSLR